MRRVKWFCLLVAIALLVIIVFQNLAQTEVHLLFWTATMPQAALLSIAIVAGFLLALSANALWKVRAWRVRASAAKHDTQGSDTPSS